MLVKNLYTSKLLLNVNKVAFSKRTYYKGKKSAKRAVKAPIIRKPIVQHKSTFTNITGRGPESSINSYAQHQFKWKNKIKRDKEAFWAGQNLRKKILLFWKKPRGGKLNPRVWRQGFIKNHSLAKAMLNRLVFSKKSLNYRTLLPFIFFSRTLNTLLSRRNIRKTRGKKQPWIPKHYHTYLRRFLKKKYTHTFLKKRSKLLKKKKWNFVKNTNLRFLSKLATYADYKRFSNWDSYPLISKSKERINKKMLWYKKSKIKAPYNLVLKSKLRNKKVLPKLLKGSFSLTRSSLRRRSRNFILKKMLLGKKFIESTRIKHVIQKNLSFKRKLTIKFSSMKLKKKKIKWPLVLKSKVKFWNKKSRPIKDFFLKKARRIFIKKKKISSFSFLLKHKLVIPNKNNLLDKNFHKKSHKEQKQILTKRKNKKREIKQQLADLRTFDSKIHLNLSSRQMDELNRLKTSLQNKDKFSLLGRNMQVVRIQNLVNANLFLTSFKSSSNISFNSKTNKNSVGLVKIKRVIYKELTSFNRKKLSFFKKKYSRITKTSSKFFFKSFFKSLAGIKQPHQTRSLLPNNGNSLLLVFTWKLKYLKSLFSKNLSLNQNLFQLGSTIQALIIDANFRFVKTTSPYFNTNDDLFHLVGSSILKSTTDTLGTKLILNLTTSKTNLLTSILDKNNYQLLSTLSLQNSKVFKDAQLKNISNSLLYDNILNTRTTQVEDYSALVNFLNDFSFSKITKKVNVLSRTSWAVTIPGTVISTNSLNRNHMAKNTFVSNIKDPVNNKFNLLFYRKKIPNFKKLLLLTSQRVAVGPVHGPNQASNWSPNTQLFTALSTPNYKFKNVSLEGLGKTNVRAPKKKFQSLKKLLKPILRLKSRNLKRYMFKRKFTKVSNCLLSFRKLYNTHTFNKNQHSFKKKFALTHYTKGSKSISYNLLRYKQPTMVTEKFILNYSAITTHRLLLQRKKRSTKVTLPRQIQKKLIRIKIKKVLKHRFSSKQTKHSTKKIKLGINSLRRPYNRLGKKITSLFHSHLKGQLTLQATSLKRNQNKVMPRSKYFSTDKLFLNKQILLTEKKRVLKLLQSFSFKKNIYKLTKYIKRRLASTLTTFNYPNYKTTRRFKISKFYFDSPKGDLSTLVSTNNRLPFTNYSAISSLNKNFKAHTSYGSDVFISMFMQSPFIAKIFTSNNQSTTKNYNSLLLYLITKNSNKFKLSNILPAKCFKHRLTRKIYNLTKLQTIQENFTPWYYNTLVRFMEHCSGKKCLFQFYPFVNNDVEHEFYVRYKKWIPRMAYYERRLGHRFFLEEAIHIMHLSFFLKDPKLICSWLKAIILRISFWKTRSIFRFLKYLIHNYYIYTFPDLGLKGLKIKLKGKISAAGNSRKRTILYRVGKTSHSQVSLRVVNEFMTINTFTGVMGFQIWLFY